MSATQKPLTITRTEASTMCGLTPSGFDVWVRKGIVPGPVAGTRRWSVAALEHALNGMPEAGGSDADAIFARWLRENGAA